MAVVSPEDARVVEGAGLGISPAWRVGIGIFHLANDLGMNAMLTIKIDAIPVDEAIAAPNARHSHGVVFKNRPMPTARDASGAGVEPNGNPFVSEVALVVADLVSGRE